MELLTNRELIDIINGSFNGGLVNIAANELMERIVGKTDVKQHIAAAEKIEMNAGVFLKWTDRDMLDFAKTVFFNSPGQAERLLIDFKNRTNAKDH